MNLRNAKNNHLHRRAKIAVKELSEREVNWFLFFLMILIALFQPL